MEQISLRAVTESVYTRNGFVMEIMTAEMEPMRLLIVDLNAVSISVHPHVHICSILAVCIKSDPCFNFIAKGSQYIRTRS